MNEATPGRAAREVLEATPGRAAREVLEATFRRTYALHPNDFRTKFEQARDAVMGAADAYAQATAQADLLSRLRTVLLDLRTNPTEARIQALHLLDAAGGIMNENAATPGTGALFPCCRHCDDGDGMLPCGEVHDEACGTGDCGLVTDAELAEWRKGLQL